MEIYLGGWGLTNILKYDSKMITLEASAGRETVHNGTFISFDALNESSEDLIGKPVLLYKSYAVFGNPLDHINDMTVIGEIKSVKPMKTKHLFIIADLWPHTIPRDYLSYLDPEAGWCPLSYGIADATAHEEDGTYNGIEELGPRKYDWKATELKWDGLILKLPGAKIVGDRRKKDKKRSASTSRLGNS